MMMREKSVEMQEDISEQRIVLEAAEILRTMMMKKQWKMIGKRMMNLNLEIVRNAGRHF